MELTIIVPTFNEGPNVAELVRRASGAVRDIDAEILFVDDSTDDTARVIEQVAQTSAIPVRVLRRSKPEGGLGGAVIAGLRQAHADVCVVMDGDLQHPPEEIETLFARYQSTDADLVVASRYVGDGDSSGLAGQARVFVSRASTALTKAMFPRRLSGVTDPMTGFFLVDRRAIDIDALQPRGFKILLEILARNSLTVREIPFRFAERTAGESKAGMKEGLRFLTQLTALRFGKMSLFAIIGGLGALANIAIVWALVHFGMGNLPAMIIAAEVTIIANFLAQERFVFQDMTSEAGGVWSRFAKSFGFNNAEAVVRIPITALMTSTMHISVVVATALTLVLAFVVRFMFHSLVVYAPKKQAAVATVAERSSAVEG